MVHTREQEDQESSSSFSDQDYSDSDSEFTIPDEAFNERTSDSEGDADSVPKGNDQTEDTGKDTPESGETADRNPQVEQEKNNIRPTRCRKFPKMTPEQVECLLAAFWADPSYPRKIGDRMEELVKQTGLAVKRIQHWFKNQRRATRLEDLLNLESVKHVAARKVLLAAYAEDPNTPSNSSDRLKKLCSATKVSARTIQLWFKRQAESTGANHKKLRQKSVAQLEVLFAALEEDPSTPEEGSRRLDDLTTATGLASLIIQQWFRHQRLKNANGQAQKRKPDCSSSRDLHVRKILCEAFWQDTSTPLKRGRRMAGLCTTTGLGAQAIQNWFNRQRKSKHSSKPDAVVATREHLSVTGKENVRNVEGDSLNNHENSVAGETLRKRSNTDVVTSKEVTVKKEGIDDFQLKILLSAFDNQPVAPGVTTQRMLKLCADTGLEKEVIRKWFRQQQEESNAVPPKQQPGQEKTPEQLVVLKAAFEQDSQVPKNGSERLEQLAQATGLMAKQVREWFGKVQTNERKRLAKEALVTAEEKINKKKREEEEAQHAAREKEKSENIKKILHEMYRGDSSIPKKTSERMKKICMATGLDATAIIYWFRNRQKLDQKKLDKLSEPEASTGEAVAEKQTTAKAETTKEANQNKRVVQLKREVSNRKTGLAENKEQAISATNHRACANKTYKTPKYEICEDHMDPEQEVVSDNTKDQKASATSPTETLETCTVDTVTAGNTTTKAKNCPVCGSLCAVQSISIVSATEAEKLDKHFGSSLTHFLAYTRAVRVCMAHTMEYRNATK